jgi:hypothetical protein
MYSKILCEPKLSFRDRMLEREGLSLDQSQFFNVRSENLLKGVNGPQLTRPTANLSYIHLLIFLVRM